MDNPHALMDEYIDTTIRLERCETLMRTIEGTRIRNGFYDHAEKLKDKLEELHRKLDKVGYDED